MAERSTSVRNLVILAVVVVTAFVLATVLGLGGSDGDDAATTTSTTTTTAPPTTTTTTAPATTTTAVVVPDGDYAAVCGELQAKLAAFAGDATVEGFTTLFESLDFDLLVRASNDWLRPSAVTLQGYRDQVLGILQGMDPADDFTGFDSSVLPPDYYEALSRLTAVAAQKCSLTPG